MGYAASGPAHSITGLVGPCCAGRSAYGRRWGGERACSRERPARRSRRDRSADPEKREQYLRAESACLEGRGYCVN